MSLILEIIHPTVIKSRVANSAELSPTEQYDLVLGRRFTAIDWAIAPSNHIGVVFSQEFSGYFYKDHISLTQDGVNVLEPKQLVTADQFYAIAPQTSLAKLTPLVAPLNIALAKYDITTPLRICHFLAQTCHESDQFNTTEEYASGSEYNDRPDLGNTSDGDGERYKGRSFIQITGKYNYQDFSNYLGVDFVSNPELLATPDYAWLGAGWFWEKNQLNDLADSDNLLAITRVVNGGTNGIDSRLDALNRAKQVFGI